MAKESAGRAERCGLMPARQEVSESERVTIRNRKALAVLVVSPRREVWWRDAWYKANVMSNGMIKIGRGRRVTYVEPKHLRCWRKYQK